jgi:hypothetical protein
VFALPAVAERRIPLLKSAWFMNRRIRFAPDAGSFDKLSGDVVSVEKITGTGAKDKVVVTGILERGGKVALQ